MQTTAPAVKKSKMTVALKCLGMLAIFWLLTRVIHLGELREAFAEITIRDIIILLLISVLLIYVSALKWKFFIEARGESPSVLKLFNLYMVGYFVNLVFPSYLGGDLVRSMYAGKQVGQVEAFTATVLERYTGLLAMLLLAFGFMWIAPGVTFQIKVVVACTLFGFLAATLVALSRPLLDLLQKISFLSGPVKQLRKVQEGLHLARKDPSLLIKTMALSFLYHSFTAVNVAVAGQAVGWNDASFLGILVVLPIVLLVTALPLTPNGLGLHEVTYVYFFHGIGATEEQALAFSLVLRAKGYLIALCGGVVWMLLRRKKEFMLSPREP